MAGPDPAMTETPAWSAARRIVPVSGDGRVRPGHDKGHRSGVRPAGITVRGGWHYRHPDVGAKCARRRMTRNDRHIMQPTREFQHSSPGEKSPSYLQRTADNMGHYNRL